jgi:dTDP-4-dehydrorhamnose reductase
MRVILFGATGLLGKPLMRLWDQGSDQITGLGSKDADIRDAGQVRSVVSAARPDLIVLAAAYTNVDGCESNRELAFAVNSLGAAHVAQAARENGARLLFVSTDYVFNGAGTAPYPTDAPRDPQSVYGHSKAQAEELILQILPDACIVRTSWLFGKDGKCFPDTILKLAASRPEISVVNDQRGCPTHARDLASAIIQLSRAGASGMIHATNRGDCTWYDFAREIVARAGLPAVVKPTTSAQYVLPAKRPKYSVLSAASLEKLGIIMPSWGDALNQYLAERNSA